VKPVTVQELRSSGYRIQVYVFRLATDEIRGLDTSKWLDKEVIAHSRPVTDMRETNTAMWANGGVTHMLVWKPKRADETGSNPDYEVKAVCSIRDQFRKKVGMIKCLGRLTSAMEKDSG
jgi:hypothetical protein